jgi:hypothetical protein
MAFDPATGDLVLFGGYGGSYRNDTWTYDGTTWTSTVPGDQPSARSGRLDGLRSVHRPAGPLRRRT